MSPRRVAIACGRVPGGAEVGGDEGNDQSCIPNGGQRDEDRATVGLVGQEPCQLDRESRLAGATGTDDREQAWVALEPQRRGVEELALAAEKVRRGSGKVDGTRRSQRRELPRPELEQLGRGVEVLQPVAPEVAQRLILDERRRRGREDHLAAVGERGDAGAAVDVDPDVALGSNGRCAGVEPHPHGDRARRERLLRGGRSGDGAGCGGERDEERVALGVDLDTTRGGERVAQHAAVLGERVGIAAGAELPQQPGRALDVGEQQRDRSRREGSRHAREYRSGAGPRGSTRGRRRAGDRSATRA